MGNNKLVLFVVASLFLIIICIIYFVDRNKRKYVPTLDFDNEKKRMRPFCSEQDYLLFIAFLRRYEGGYVRRKSGRTVGREYLGKEKGDLKGIFYHVIVPNPNLTVSQKEEFRKLIIGLGVDGVNERPSYEVRDSQLKNRETKRDDYLRKEVGNIGEQIVRDELDELDGDLYYVINGPVLKMDGVTKEYDHIVIGSTGVFAIETKAFGMTDGRPCKAALFVDRGDKWILRRKQKNKDLESPTEQVVEEKNLLEKIISCPVEIHSVLVLSNTELFIKQNIKLPYEVVRADGLTDLIEKYPDRLSLNDKTMILQDIDKHRLN